MNAVNIYTHPIGTPVRYVSTIGDTPAWMTELGTVVGTWMTRDEPDEEPYRVYRVALRDGGFATWDHAATHYDFDWRERREVWCTDVGAHVLTDLRDLV